MSILEPLLNLDAVSCRLEAGSRKRVLQHIAAQMATPTLHQDHIFDQLLARERLGSTALGEGVAIPHCRLDTDTMRIAVITTQEPVDFEAADGERVDIFFVLIVPEDERQAHLRALAELSATLSIEAHRKSLRQCTTQEDLFATMKTMLAAAAA